MNKKGILSISMALIMGLSMAAGCGNNESGASTSAGSQTGTVENEGGG